MWQPAAGGDPRLDELAARVKQLKDQVEELRQIVEELLSKQK